MERMARATRCCPRLSRSRSGSRDPTKRSSCESGCRSRWRQNHPVADNSPLCRQNQPIAENSPLCHQNHPLWRQNQLLAAGAPCCRQITAMSAESPLYRLRAHACQMRLPLPYYIQMRSTNSHATVTISDCAAIVGILPAWVDSAAIGVI